LYSDQTGVFFRHLSTFPERSTIKEAVLELLSVASRHIFFCNFLLQDEDVVQALLDANQRLNGHVYVLTTLKADDLAGVEGSEDGADFESHMACIQRMTQQGMLVKARSDCHAKFLTIDDSLAIVTSANAVPTCYGNVPRPGSKPREANPENGVFLSIPGEVRRLANFFRALWRRGCNYKVAPDPKAFDVQQITAATQSVTAREPTAPADEGEVLWTAPGDCRILERLLGMVRGARESISLSTWVIKGMDTHELGRALHESAQRGVQLQALVRGMRRDDHRRQCYLLARDLGQQIAILGDYWNHSKAVVIDGKEAMVLSANLDAQHGLNNGIEVGFYSRQEMFVKAVQGFLARLTADAKLEFVANPTQATVADRYGSQKGQRLGGKLRIRFFSEGNRNDRLAERFCQAAETDLVRIAWCKLKGQDALALATDQMVLYCRPMRGQSLEAYEISDNPRNDERSLFDSYLRAAEIVLET
jgi:hypothetical protein